MSLVQCLPSMVGIAYVVAIRLRAMPLRPMRRLGSDPCLERLFRPCVFACTSDVSAEFVDVEESVMLEKARNNAVPRLSDGVSVDSLIDRERLEVSQRVYTDPQIYQLELDRIWSKA